MKRYFVIALLGFQINAIAQTPSYVPVDSLMGWWPFNNNAVDESLNTNDGTVNGAVITTNCTGTPNAAYNFNGYSNGITIPALDLSTGDEMSISVWVNPSSLTSHMYHEIIRQDNGYTGAPDFLLSFQDFGTILSFGVGTTTSYSELDVNISSSAYLNTWTHIVVVYNGAHRQVYKNAVLISSDLKTGNVTHTATNFTVGCEPTYMESQEFFQGKIDDIGIWRRALTAKEILTLYNGGLSTGINSADSQQAITIYPNPATSDLFVRTNEKETRLEIYSLLGSKVLESQLNAGENKLDLNSLSKGEYILKIYDKENEMIKVDKLILSY